MTMKACPVRPVRAVASAAMKADVAEQFKAEKTVTERTAEDAVVEGVADQTCRSPKVDENANTSVTMITVKPETAQAVTEEATVIKATEEKSVSSVAETVLKHETVQEVTVDRDCRSSGAPD